MHIQERIASLKQHDFLPRNPLESFRSDDQEWKNDAILSPDLSHVILFPLSLVFRFDFPLPATTGTIVLKPFLTKQQNDG